MSEISISVTQEELCIERLEDLGNGLVGVDGQLKVSGIQHLCIADGWITPRVTTGNTMAPCMIIGERAAGILRKEHKL